LRKKHRIHGFKEYCALLFFQSSALLNDANGFDPTNEECAGGAPDSFTPTMADSGNSC
jgi:hypothetical protein